MTEVEETSGTDSVLGDFDDGGDHVDSVALSPPVRARTHQGRLYRRGAVALAILGSLALAGAFVLPDARSVLVAFGATGLFGATLLRYVRPERSIAARTGESVYTAFARTGEDLVAELDLSNERVYAPPTGDGNGSSPARLFVPADPDTPVPSPGELTHLSVGDADHFSGIAVRPSGVGLYREFLDVANAPHPEHPAAVASQVTDALSNQFELVEEVSMVDGHESVQFVVAGCEYGHPDRFDHPVVSFSAVCLVATLDVPVSVDVAARDAGAYVVTCAWHER